MIDNEKVLVHVILVNSKKDDVIYKYMTHFPPSKGQVIRIDDQSFYKITNIVWCLDEPDMPYARINIGVVKC